MQLFRLTVCAKCLYVLMLATLAFWLPSGLQAQSNLDASLNNHDFGIVAIGHTGSQYLVLTNTGTTSSISLTALSFSGADPAAFSATLAGLPLTLAAGDSVSFFVEFNPVSSGAQSATLTIEHNGANADTDISLTGEGCEFVSPGGAGNIYLPAANAFKAEIEDAPATDDWVQYSATVNSENITFYTWEGDSYANGPGSVGLLSYQFAIQTPGLYRFQFHALQGNPASPGDDNDVWLKFTTGDAKAIKGDPLAPDSEIDLTDGDWLVAYKASTAWDWETKTVFGNAHDIYVEFATAGIYELQFTARSPNFSIDKWVLYKGTQDPDAIPFSATGTEQSCPDQLWYLDADADGFGNPAASTYASAQPTGYVADNTDCDDNEPNAYPGNTEIEDGIDNNCDGNVDEGFMPELPWYEDSDNDTYGNPAVMLMATTQPAGYVADNTDCDDTDPNIHPGATEVFDGEDNDCDGFTDEGFVPWYQDDDGDGFGNAAVVLHAVSQPAGYVADNTDCDDTDPNTYPGATELDDDKDNDCDGQVDEGFTDWREITGFTGEPIERHENAFVKAGDKFVLLGGRSSDTKNVEIYDPILNTWTHGALHPMEMHHFQGVEMDGLIYVIGAFTGDFPNEVGIRNIFIYDPVADQWHQGPPIPSDRVRGSAAAIGYEGKIYILSGLTDGHRSGHVTWFDVFDPRTNSWIQLPDAPRARDHFHVALWGDKIVVAGGRRSKYENGGLHVDLENAIDVYDISDGTWSVLPTLLPTKRAGTAVALIGDEIFVIGGESGEQQDAYDETEALNLMNLNWNTYDPLNEGRHGTQALVCNEVAYIAAGSRLQGSDEIKFDDPYFMEKFSPTQTYNPPDCPGFLSTGLTGGANYGFVSSDTVIFDTVAIVNPPGAQAIIISALAFEGLDKNDFVITPLFSNPADPFGTFMPFVLAPGDSLKFAVEFRPTDATEKDAYFLVTHSRSPVPEQVPLLAESCFGEIVSGGGDYQESGGLLMMQVESQGPNGWTVNTAGGLTYYTWNGGDHWGGGEAGNFGYLSYPFEIQTPGTYRFQMHSLQGNFANPDAEDDVWINFPDADGWITSVGAGSVPLAGWTKIYQNDVSGWTWETYAQFDGSEIYLTFNNPGTYHLEMSGRSNGFSVDRFVLYMGAQDPNAIPESSTGGVVCVNDWYLDADNDGFGDPLISQQSAEPIAGYVNNNNDCNDADPNVNPNAVDIDDGLDNNCNGIPDEGWVGECQTLRINCGSDSAYTDGLGNVFSADNFAYYTASVPFGTDTLSIANTTDSTLYHTERTVLPGQFSFSYQFPVVNGPYTVRLHFAEIYHGIAPGTGDGIGNRLINVSAEDTLKLSNYDIVAQAGGPATAIIETITTYVDDGQLDLLFSASADNPKISAIEVIPLLSCGRELPLPVELLDFEAKYVKDRVELRWATASETANDRFEIERSYEGGAFETISWHPSKGNSQQLQQYSSLDFRAKAGKNQYRLRQVDIDGHYTYSQIVEVEVPGELVYVYPNPRRKGDSWTIQLHSNKQLTLKVQVLDMLGHRLQSHLLHAAPGSHALRLPANDLPAGSYLLLIQAGTQLWQYKMIVLE